jgi:hypothetical protein
VEARPSLPGREVEAHRSGARWRRSPELLLWCSEAGDALNHRVYV